MGVCVCVCGGGGGSMQNLQAIFISESWSSFEIRAEFKTSETFVFFR